MESRAKLFGHSIHAMLIAFPVGLLVTAVIFDVLHLVSNNGEWTLISYYMIGAGIIGGLTAAVFGFIDYLAIPAATRAKSVGRAHGVGNVIVVVLFVISWWLRRESPQQPPSTALVFSFLGVALAAVTAWMGGELVERLGVAVDDGAHLDAPSSLSGQPASVASRSSSVH
ncbi:MAG: Protein of unknown function transrane [Gemmatimonadetes bacterium]|nr:Protein of unknown function transrane [Gemmatimonadota bacterium]